MSAQIHGFDPNDFVPIPYTSDRRCIEETVKYCGARFRTAVKAILSSNVDFRRIFQRELASLHKASVCFCPDI